LQAAESSEKAREVFSMLLTHVGRYDAIGRPALEDGLVRLAWKVSIICSDGHVAYLPKSIARTSNVISQMLDDPTVNGTGKELDVSRLDDRVGHASVSLYQLPGVPQCTKVSVERVFGYTTMDPRVNMPQKCIFDDLAVANFLELQHVIDVLCKWIARVIKQQQTVGELKEHFEMSGIVQYTAEGSTTHPTGLFSLLPADFWVLSLFTILPNSKQDMMYETCDAFRCFVQEYHKIPNTFVCLYAFKTEQGPKESKGIAILLQQMETIGKKKKRLQGNGSMIVWAIPIYYPLV